MAGIVCTVSGGKGGVGRTTSAINLGAALEQYGYDTVTVDADLSMSDMQPLLDIDVEQGLHSILAGEASVAEGSVDLPGGLTVVPGERGLDAYADADASALKQVVETIKQSVDVVIVDTGASPSHETSVAIGLADTVVLVTTPDDPAVSNASKTKRLTERLSNEVAGVLVTRVRAKDELEAVGQQLDVPVMGGIPVDDDVTGDEPLMVKALDSEVARAYGECADWFDSVVIQGEPHAEVEWVFDEAWVTEGETPEPTPEDTSPGAGRAEKEAGGTADEEEDEFTGGALPFG